MNFKGQVIGSYQIKVQAKNWKRAKQKAKKAFNAEKNLGKPQNGAMKVGHLAATKGSWL